MQKFFFKSVHACPKSGYDSVCQYAIQINCALRTSQGVVIVNLQLCHGDLE